MDFLELLDSLLLGNNRRGRLLGLCRFAILFTGNFSQVGDLIMLGDLLVNLDSRQFLCLLLKGYFVSIMIRGI